MIQNVSGMAFLVGNMDRASRDTSREQLSTSMGWGAPEGEGSLGTRGSHRWL